MADRQDIDALLIGALYGELEGDERERLEAHLVSHPQDRAALDEMRSTRSLLRDANLATALGSAEPAPAISAKLIQEAARRAPAPRVAQAGFFGFIAGLLRPLVLHPGLSAAAAVVLIGGTVAYMKSNDRMRVAEPQLARSADTMSAPASPAGAADDRAAVTTTAATAPDPVGAGAVAAGEGSSFAVQLDERERAAKDELVAGAKREQAADKPAAKLGRSGGPAFEAVADNEKRSAKKTAPRLESAAGKAKVGGYLEVDQNTDDVVPLRDFDGRPVTGTAPGGSTGAGAGAVPESAPPPPQAPAPTTRDRGGAYDAKADVASNAWARDQHARMVKLVQSNKCNDAGQLGAEISRRAPEYYQANVANDRQVRQCIQYVDSARRQRAQEQTKSRAAQPRRDSPAADESLEPSKAAH